MLMMAWLANHSSARKISSNGLLKFQVIGRDVVI
jgi:hypothetical protein